MTSLKTSIKTITYLSDIGCLEIQGASLDYMSVYDYPVPTTLLLHVILSHSTEACPVGIRNVLVNPILLSSIALFLKKLCSNIATEDTGWP